MGEGDSVLEVLGVAGKADMAPAAAGTAALGGKGPPPAPFLGGSQMGFNLKQRREA